MITEITRIFDILMNRLNMSLQISFLRKLMTTQITRIFDFLMDRLNMSLQIDDSNWWPHRLQEYLIPLWVACSWRFKLCFVLKLHPQTTQIWAVYLVIDSSLFNLYYVVFQDWTEIAGICSSQVCIRELNWKKNQTTIIYIFYSYL